MKAISSLGFRSLCLTPNKKTLQTQNFANLQAIYQEIRNYEGCEKKEQQIFEVWIDFKSKFHSNSISYWCKIVSSDTFFSREKWKKMLLTTIFVKVDMCKTAIFNTKIELFATSNESSYSLILINQYQNPFGWVYYSKYSRYIRNSFDSALEKHSMGSFSLFISEIILSHFHEGFSWFDSFHFRILNWNETYIML